MPPRLAYRRPAVPESVRPLRTAARSFAEEVGACDETVGGVQLAVSEAVTNAVLHAYPTTSGDVELEACVEGGVLHVDVSDHGCGMRPRDDSPGAGVGLRVIAALVGALRIDASRRGDGTCVHMCFAL